MGSRRSEVLLVAALFVFGTALYALRWLLFPGEVPHSEMWRFLIGDVAFLFLQVAFVTFFIDRLLRERERRALLQKLNMVIGAFFSEIGGELLGRIAGADRNLASVRDDLIPRSTWTPTHYALARQALARHKPSIDVTACDLHELKEMLVRHRQFVLGLLGNQALLDHQAFTELLWAITHLAEELQARQSLENLPEADAAHIAVDIRRAYNLLTSQWLDYMSHLQAQYPFLFSLAVRLNPFDPEAHPEISA
ncbi:MAG: hypothetical protein HGA39_04205 [Coriobacteriia bacterium]|nr:hypothetical protein [Coriobacteriia bacterium]